MTPLARLLFAAGIVAAAAGLVLICIARQQTRQQTRQSVAAPAAAPQLAIEQTAATIMPPDSGERADYPSARVEALEINVPAPQALKLGADVLAWEQHLQTIANQPSKSGTAKARAMLALLSTLPEEALAEAAERAVERLPDADYAAVAWPMVTDAKTHGQVMSVLFADLMERPDAITLPVLLRIARDPTHPFATSAKDNLKLLLRADFGSDWTRWESEVKRVASGATH